MMCFESHSVFPVGLDAAGKTTILYKLKLGEIVTTIPTIGRRYFTPILIVMLLFFGIISTHIQDSTWRRWNTRTFALQSGTWVVRTRLGLSGATTSRSFTIVFTVDLLDLNWGFLSYYLLLKFQNTQGLIFVVDSNDRERISEAREELQKMVSTNDIVF